MNKSNHLHGENCPHCGHSEARTVDAQVKGRGAMRTVAVVECQDCGQLWGEPRDFYGVLDDD